LWHLLPLSPADLLSTIQTDKRLTTLAAAIKAAGIESTLAGPGPFTIFAPVDAAFDREPWADYKVKYLLDPANKDKLTSLLEYHVVSGAIKSSELSVGESLTTLEGQDLTVGKNATNTVIDDVTCDSAGLVHKEEKKQPNASVDKHNTANQPSHSTTTHSTLHLPSQPLANVALTTLTK
jgi:uncharacterized surface protein with fasciclin (FAS1) repeats